MYKLRYRRYQQSCDVANCSIIAPREDCTAPHYRYTFATAYHNLSIDCRKNAPPELPTMNVLVRVQIRNFSIVRIASWTEHEVCECFSANLDPPLSRTCMIQVLDTRTVFAARCDA